jgi:hypothetical protein
MKFRKTNQLKAQNLMSELVQRSQSNNVISRAQK